MKKTFKRILAFIPLFIILLMTAVLASKSDQNTIKLIYPNGLVIQLNTDKTYIKDILVENNISLQDNQIYLPEEKIDFTKTIKILDKKDLEGDRLLSTFAYEQIVSSYDTTVEKQIVVTEEIPFKTINRSGEAYGSDRVTHILQEGKNGLKEITYKVFLVNNEEVDRKEVSSKVIEEPIDKIVEMHFPISRGSSRDLSPAKNQKDLFKQRSTGKKTLTAIGGVYRYNGRKETYYSSRVLYHYKTPQWIVDDEGFYRNKEGYYVVAASDMPQGTVFQGSKGQCIVLDSGCAKGTTDYYVNW